MHLDLSSPGLRRQRAEAARRSAPRHGGLTAWWPHQTRKKKPGSAYAPIPDQGCGWQTRDRETLPNRTTDLGARARVRPQPHGDGLSYKRSLRDEVPRIIPRIIQGRPAADVSRSLAR